MAHREETVWKSWLAGDSSPSSFSVWVSKKANPLRFVFNLSLKCGPLASSLGVLSEPSRQLYHTVLKTLKEEACPGSCALRGKVSQHVPWAWALPGVLSQDAFSWLGCHRPPGQIPPLGSSDHCLRVAASSPSLQEGAGLLMSADEGTAPLTVFAELTAVDQHTGDNEDSQGHNGDHHQGSDGLLLLAGSHHSQEVCMLTANTHVPRVADTCWLLFLHQKPAGSMEAVLSVGIWALVEVRHHCSRHG